MFLARGQITWGLTHMNFYNGNRTVTNFSLIHFCVQPALLFPKMGRFSNRPVRKHFKFDVEKEQSVWQIGDCQTRL